jgi:hypothetical protein
MSLKTGTRLGHFEVLAPIGSGGMGEVYLARDLHLGREVALKVLPDAFASDSFRLARFEREARAAAALNHPNVLAVFEVGAGQPPYVVFELLTGRTLRMLLERPLGVSRAVDYATQIADGLAAAHEKGIVHRDIKPENLFVTGDGRVKILDFVIATRADEPGSDAPPTLTAPGAVIGTAGYMAPEQVRGEPVDSRADIFALGAVLYEMLTGRGAFSRETGVDSIAAILHDEPPAVETLVPDVPPAVAAVVGHCLVKAREGRFQSARDVAFALGLANPPAAQTVTRARPNRAAIAALSLAALIVAAAVGAIFRPAADRAPTPRRVSITFPATDPLGASFDFVPFTLSSDAALLAYTTVQPERVIVRRLDDFAVTRLAGTDGAYDPFFSPDNQWLGFWAFGQIKKVLVAGGPPVVVCEAADMLGASWGENGSIVFAPGLNDGLYVVPDTGGTPQALTTVDSARNEIHHGFPQYVDGGRAVLFTALARSKDAPYSVEIVETATKQRRTLVSGAQYGRYLPTGHLVYVRNRTLYAIRVTPGTFLPAGEAAVVIEGLHAGLQGHALFSTANNGTLVYVAARAPAQSAPVWVDRNGAATETGLPVRAYHAPRVSADGRTIAVTIHEPDSADLWVATAPSPLERLTFGRRTLWSFTSVALSPDGAQLAYAEDGDGGARLMARALDSRSAARELLLSKMPMAPSAWLSGAKEMLLNVRGPSTGGDLLVMRADDDAQPVPLVEAAGNQFGPTPSADGRYVVYASDEGGRFEVFAMPYPGPGERRQLTTDGGREPVWSRKGDEIFYRQGDRVMSIPISTVPKLAHGPARVLFEGRFAVGAAGLPAYDVTADGRFLMLREERESGPLELRTVLDWFTELNRKVP